MFSPMSQIFRKNGENSPAEPAGNEDLECGHGSWVSQKPTASGYQSSPSRVYLPETRSIYTSIVPQTPIPSREYISYVQHKGQYGSAAQLPLTPSGPSRVVGYLPRTICNESARFVSPESFIMPSQPSQNTSNEELMSNNGPQCRSTSIPHIASHRSPSPESPFDPSKHGQALRRLETHGSLKTLPSCPQEADAPDRTSISWSEIGREIFGDHTAEHSVSLSRQQESRTSAGPFEKADQRLGIDLSSRPTQYLSNPIYQPEVLRRGDFGNVIKFKESLKTQDRHGLRGNLPSFVFPRPNANTDNPNQVIQQVLHQSHLPPECHQKPSPESRDVEPEGANSLPDLPSSDLGEIDEYLWSPAPSEDEQESSSVLVRYSGIVTDGVSSRPMSETELEEAVMLSLGSSSSQEYCHLDHEQIREKQARPKESPPDPVRSLSADAGPGSSQTSSSLSMDRYAGYKVRQGDNSLPSSRTRCPTPPLLFGRHAISAPKKSTARLPTPICSSGEQDWETVTKTGSSLADKSDSGNLSLSNETSYPLREAGPVIRHPRHNRSYMLLRNSQTGDLVQIPQRADSTYQHPSPLRIEHRHPFTSSPPVVRFVKPPAISVKYSDAVMEPDRLNSESSSSGLSEGVLEPQGKQTQNSLYKTKQNLPHVSDSAIDQSQYMMDFQEQSHQSSAWLSTVSKVASSEPSLPGNGATSTDVVIWNGKGLVNITPERGGNREVGSSLADASSPGATFSSSPASRVNPTVQFSDIPPSLGQHFQRQLIGHDSDHSSGQLLGDFHKSLATSFNREDTTTSIAHTENHSRSHSASGPEMKHSKPSPRRRRSSSESDSRLMDSPLAQKASALNVSSSDGYAQQNPRSGLLLRNPFSHADDNESQHGSNRHNVIERRLRQPKADEGSVDEHTPSSSTESRPFVRDGVVYTDVPAPVFDHPIYGRERPWDRMGPTHTRPRPQPNPLRRPLVPRPIARAESPHLHRIPHPPTRELLERHVLLSRLYLVMFSLLPPIAIIYGHGYMDGIMRFHTEGEINGFRDTEKNIALCLGYGLSALCVPALVVVIIIISASK